VSSMIIKKNITKPESFAFVRSQLDKGTTLSSCINMLSIEKGELFAFVPAETSEDALFKFESGGIYSYEDELNKKQTVIRIKNESKPLVMREIELHLTSSTNNCCLFEDSLAIPSDAWVGTSQVKYVHFQSKEMFYFFDNTSSDQEEINEAFKQSESHVFLSALSSLGSNDRAAFSAYKEVTLIQLELFAKNISSFFVNAYDHEGYLMWVKKE
jgi:hypothetical protein